jgi:hypothetical protein
MSRLEAERRILERIYSTDEWQDNGESRLLLIQTAWDNEILPWCENWRIDKL